MSLVVLIALASFLGGVLQIVAGFGAATVSMCFLPYVMSDYLSAATLATVMGFFICLYAAVSQRRHIQYKVLAAPLCSYFVTCAIFVRIAASQPDQLLKRLFGFFLIALSVYSLALNRRFHIRSGMAGGLTAGFFGGMFSGLFSSGAPPIVLYLLAACTDHVSYLATMQGYFVVATFYNVLMRILNGMLTDEVLRGMVVAIPMAFLGAQVGKKLSLRLDAVRVRQIGYILIGLNGIIMLLRS